MPDISVLMPAYNAEKYIEETIKSVLLQSFKNFEFIIINDGSVDSTEKIILKFQDDRIIYLKQQNQGLSKTLNYGLSIAKGKYIARIDADDVCYSYRLDEQFKFMETNPDYVVCSSFADVITETGEYIYTFKVPINDIDIQGTMINRNCFVHPSSFYKRETALRINGYYTDYNIPFEDYLFFYNLIQQGKAYNIPKALIQYRLVPSAVSLRTYSKRYKQLIKTVLVQGHITSQQFEFLESFLKSKRKLNTKLSNNYLTISRLFFIHKKNFSKFIHYFILAIKTKPLNPNIILSLLYVLYKLLFKINNRKPV